MKTQTLLAVTLAAVSLSQVNAVAQQPDAHPAEGRRGGQFQGRERQGVAGTITEISPSALKLKTFQGQSVTVKISGETTYRRDREEGRLSDLKVGDFVFVGGEPGAKDSSGNPEWNARLVAKRTGGPGGPGGMMFNREDLGKKFIAGTVTKIDGTKLSVKRPDDVEQTIEVDDDTSFLNNKHENVTLADIKVGDFVGGQGELKNGTFVPKTLRVGPPPRFMREPDRDGPGTPPPPPAPGTTAAPSTAAPDNSAPQDKK